ncbi:MAG: PilZ domain-containing protein [Pseudomonadota bacterium]
MAAADASPAAATDSGSRYTTDRADIRHALQHFRNERTVVQLRFAEPEAALTGRVLDVDQKHLLLEDIKPRDQLDTLLSEHPFTLTARSPGVYLYAEGLVCLLRESERGVPFYIVTLPEQVLFQQRRRAARVTLPMRVKAEGAQAYLQLGKQNFRSDIIDISAGGCRLSVAGDQTTTLVTGAELSSCVLDFANRMELESKAVIRHAFYDPRNQCTSCGVELTHMHVTDRRRLEQFVESQQRRARLTPKLPNR